MYKFRCFALLALLVWGGAFVRSSAQAAPHSSAISAELKVRVNYTPSRSTATLTWHVRGSGTCIATGYRLHWIGRAPTDRTRHIRLLRGRIYHFTLDCRSDDGSSTASSLATVSG